MKRLILLVAFGLAAGRALAQQSVVDGFEGGANKGGWTFNVTNPDVLEPAGGNPNAWLHNDLVISFAPILTTQFGLVSEFVGDYRAANVTMISIDARTNTCSLGCEGRNFALLLRDTKGTSDPEDDDYTYRVDDAVLIPAPGAGWVHYDFPIPSQTNDPVPAGWTGGWAGDLENFRPGVDFADVISNVDRVEFWWLHPAFVALLQDWDIGVDNVALVAAGTPGDFDGDGDVDLSDFAVFAQCYGRRPAPVRLAWTPISTATATSI
jgi:hypothetical protein